MTKRKPVPIAPIINQTEFEKGWSDSFIDDLVTFPNAVDSRALGFYAGYKNQEKRERDNEAARKKTSEEQADEDQRNWALTMNLINGVDFLDNRLEFVEDDAAAYDITLVKGHRAMLKKGRTVTPERLRRISKYLLALAKAMESKST